VDIPIARSSLAQFKRPDEPEVIKKVIDKVEPTPMKMDAA
jgi:hypothetical protein